MNTLTIYTGIGKRKTSTAKVFLKSGTGNLFINTKPYKEYFQDINEEANIINFLFFIVNLKNTYDIFIIVKGGGIMSQLNAIKLAVAKAISHIKPIYKKILNNNLLLRQDSRIKERRKYGLKKARKASQYSKR
jgi:small subunit ribosomal protein S9